MLLVTTLSSTLSTLSDLVSLDYSFEYMKQMNEYGYVKALEKYRESDFRGLLHCL